eukprot:gene16215-12541_t
MTFRGSLLVLGALVGTAWSEMKADVSLHTVCSSSAFEVLTINRATSTIIEKAELQSRPDEEQADLQLWAFEQVKTDEAKVLMKQLSEDGCVELKVDHPLSDRGYTAIVRVLADSMAPGTTRWSFMSEASFSDSAAVEIADAVAGNPSVVALGFRNNIGIGPEGGKAIAAMLLANHFVEELDLYDTTIRDDGAEAIIAPGVVLEQLVLQKNKITDVGGAKLAQGIAKRAVQWGEQNAEESSLKELDLKNNYVGDQTAFALAKVLTDEPNNMLQKLRLDVNPGITDRAAKRLADMLAVN